MNLKPLGDRLIVEVLGEGTSPSATSCFRTRRKRSRSAAGPAARAAGTTAESSSPGPGGGRRDRLLQVRGHGNQGRTDEYRSAQADVLARSSVRASGWRESVSQGGRRTHGSQRAEVHEDARRALERGVNTSPTRSGHPYPAGYVVLDKKFGAPTVTDGARLLARSGRDVRTRAHSSSAK
jgi:hypothetical protein